MSTVVPLQHSTFQTFIFATGITYLPRTKPHLLHLWTSFFILNVSSVLRFAATSHIHLSPIVRGSQRFSPRRSMCTPDKPSSSLQPIVFISTTPTLIPRQRHATAYMYHFINDICSDWYVFMNEMSISVHQCACTGIQPAHFRDFPTLSQNIMTVQRWRSTLGNTILSLKKQTCPFYRGWFYYMVQQPQQLPLIYFTPNLRAFHEDPQQYCFTIHVKLSVFHYYLDEMVDL